MRLPVLSEDAMDPRQQELAARIAGRRGAVRGPFRVWLHSPEMCERAESLGAFARFDIPGLTEHAFGMKTLAEAAYIRDHVISQLDL
ncbi:hypothetical protein ABZ372_48255, partial [Streptomyces sp. NPDC005921]